MGGRPRASLLVYVCEMSSVRDMSFLWEVCEKKGKINLRQKLDKNYTVRHNACKMLALNCLLLHLQDNKKELYIKSG